MVVSVLNQADQKSAEVAADLGLPLVEEATENYLLLVDEGQWTIKNASLGPRFSLRFEPEKELQRLKLQKLNPKKDLLCRALGVSDKPEVKVLDGTLGFAKDALHLLACKRKVVGVERNPLIFHLLKSGLEKCTGVDLEIHRGETERLMERLSSECEVLYLDPMFENAKSKSAPKKHMSFLRETVDPQMDVEKLVEKALKSGFKRAVVKRALDGDLLAGKASQVFKGKLIRFDVYL